MADVLHMLRAAEELTLIDEQLARGLARMGRDSCPEVLLAAAMASRATRQGHVCLDLRRFVRPETDDVAWPSLEGWLGALEASGLVGGASDVTPLVLEGERLYLR